MESKKSVYLILEEVINEMCNKHCKFPDMYTEENEDDLYKEHCDNCPLNKLI